MAAGVELTARAVQYDRLIYGAAAVVFLDDNLNVLTSLVKAYLPQNITDLVE